MSPALNRITTAIFLLKIKAMADKVFVKGFRTFNPKQGAPDWVLGDLIIDITDFKEFVNSNQHHLTEYNGKKQLKCQITRGQNGLLISVNTFKPAEQQSPRQHSSAGIMEGPATPLEDPDDLPF